MFDFRPPSICNPENPFFLLRIERPPSPSLVNVYRLDPRETQLLGLHACLLETEQHQVVAAAAGMISRIPPLLVFRAYLHPDC